MDWVLLVLLLLSAALSALSYLRMRKQQEEGGSAAALQTLQEQLRALEKTQQLYARQQTEQAELLRQVLGNELERSRRELSHSLLQLQEGNDRRLEQLRAGNEQKLEQMRLAVDERLQKTLDARLAESFRTVSAHLESVQRGLGEMKSLASDVGGLKKALTNVKNRGIFGEVQLERILEQMLHPGQYAVNIATKHDSADRVEFALKLPGGGEGENVYLPIDSKFPIEDYERLLEGCEEGDKEKIDASKRALALRMKVFAKEISGKYIDPPFTTDFAILFLPTEGLYAEVVQNAELFESLQRDYRVTVTGPTTLSAFLNALQMGFKTLAIEKRSVEVWRVLGAVKTEFGKFAEALDSTQKKIQAADRELEKLVGTRTSAMNRQLRQVERLPEAESAALLESGDNTIPQ
ncbi:MAG: DNA recombination protein RmuC [Oscillospiraceae bacterium]|jgi:DNA recombination protein RmuC|nr:DNA recombination protein RmuC [Oscillospiraceae bacterium]